MICYTGTRVWPEDETSAPTLEDIAAGLGRLPRFMGASKEWYPVLCHVLTVAFFLPDEFAIHGLLHDAPEACMSDVPTTWKTEAARDQEGVLLRRIYQSLEVEDFPLSDEAQRAVEFSDAAALAAEAHVLGHAAAEEFWPDPDEHVMQITKVNLSMARGMLDPEISIPLFKAAFNHYKDLHDASS